MSKELADRVEGDLSASESVQHRARRIREAGASLETDWDEAMSAYRAEANQVPSTLVRFPLTSLIDDLDDLLSPRRRFSAYWTDNDEYPMCE